MKNTPLLTHTLGLSLLSLWLASAPVTHAKPKEKPALLCENDGQMKPCEDSQSDKVADKAKPRAFKAQASDGVTAKAKTKKKKAKVKKPRKPAAAE